MAEIAEVAQLAEVAGCDVRGVGHVDVLDGRGCTQMVEVAELDEVAGSSQGPSLSHFLALIAGLGHPWLARSLSCIA